MKTNNENLAGAYPYAPLALCLPVAEAVKSLGGGKSPVSKSLLAAHLKEDEKSTGLAFKITSSKCFGLIQGRSEFTLTEGANRYFFPTDERDSKQALLGFLSAPPAFRVIIDRFDGSKLPPLEMLGNILHKEANVPVSWKERVAGFFIRSAKTANVVDAEGYLRAKAAQHGNIANGTSLGENRGIQKLSEKPIATSNIGQIWSTVNDEYMVTPSNVWSFSQDGKTVRVETPPELSAELWKKLEGYIKLLQPAGR